REAHDKLEARSEKCLFVGYPEEFADEEPIVNTDTQQEVVTPVEPDDISLPIRRTSSRVSKTSQDPQFYYGFHIEEEKISDSTLIDLNEPANYKEAMACPKAAKWKEAMKSEIQSMYDNQVWKLWDMDVNTAFLNEKLTEDVFMAQPEGFENAKYHKRVCMLQKAIYEKVTQFGFSRSEDESCIYIKVSGSVVVFMALYADDILLIGNDIPTLQSVKEWLGKCFAMKDLGDAAYVLCIKIYRDRTRRLIGLSQDTYLDKILKRFKMENSKKGNLPLYHGIKISSDLCLKTDDELEKMRGSGITSHDLKSDCPNPFTVPEAEGVASVLRRVAGIGSLRVPYASAIGSIMYAMTCTRPDVSFALSMVSRHQQNPGEGHWTAVKNILKYLRNTKDRFLVYGGEKELRVTGYCDASWQTDKDDSKSQSGWVFLLNEGAVTWKVQSKIQWQIPHASLSILQLMSLQRKLSG
ncbi:retrotransposon protein, putative, ty1-copia subclass, partial [Tanacetum coccineum]